ncbi:hypothetical protein IU479_30795 [Nocardia abscessus]|uniref:hypothetical protein n=1 Tax=Nocardia TaxID=1817 RepID=UPI0018950C70|nr:MULTISPECIES: hypothetical protein [Nocardia]MBF6222486.1 hypothetical protein [Nocardia abscessus]
MTYTDLFSGLDLVVALDARNVEAHLGGTIDGCTACATVRGPHSACPAARAAHVHRTTTSTPAVPVDSRAIVAHLSAMHVCS